MATMTASAPAPSFMKQLAANEKSTRDQAVTNLRIYLRSRKEFSEIELLKLWKGLFYCMWMSDKMRNQQQLARDLADLVDVVPRSTFVPFIDAFWKTIAREWNGIGKLRMDKYLYLIRQFFYASLRSLARAGWKDSELLDDLMGSIAETPVNARDAKIPNGLRYHMLDIYVDELEKLDDEHEAELPVERLLAPIMVLQKGCPTKSIRKQAKEVLEDERVRNWLGLGDVEDAEANEGAGEDAMPQGQEDDDEGDWKGID